MRNVHNELAAPDGPSRTVSVTRRTSTMASNTHPKDMRTWIAELEEAGELIRIAKPVDPLTQMGSLLHLAQNAVRSG
jgi:hypothetical protein